MARLHRRGIGKVNIDKALGKNEYILQCFEGLDLAYKKLWDDAVEGSKMEADSYFWTLSRQATERVMIPIVRETVDAMDRCLLSAIMCWNGGHFPAGEIALRAGESFDKVARVLGMPYPGGAALDKAAQQGDDTKYPLPRAKAGENPYDMSFSGLKTAALNLIHHAEQVGEEIDVPSLCAGFTAAVSDTLVPRIEQALHQTCRTKLAVAGGVAANSRIRKDVLSMADRLGISVYMPPLSLCGDNAAMIGAQAYYEHLAGNHAGMELNAFATKSILGEAL